MEQRMESRAQQQNVAPKTTPQNRGVSVQHRHNSQRNNAVAKSRKVSNRKNGVIKKLLWIILILQLITAIELFALIKVLAAGEEYAFNLNDRTLAWVNGQANGIGQSDGAENVGNQSFTPGEATSSAHNSAYNSTSGLEGIGIRESREDDLEEKWKLVLVNKWNAMDPDYVPELSEVAKGHMVDSRIADSLQEMIQDAGEAGYCIYILSSYRDIDKQTYLYEAEVEEWLALGYSRSGAERKAATVVAYPGTSEHHLGLAVDLVDSTHVALDEGAEQTKGYQWLVEHCQEYGFILRYPNGATEITGIIYEPWHFRYVGEEAAREIMEKNITLEEYLSERNS